MPYNCLACFAFALVSHIQLSGIAGQRLVYDNNPMPVRGAVHGHRRLIMQALHAYRKLVKVTRHLQIGWERLNLLF